MSYLFCVQVSVNRLHHLYWHRCQSINNRCKSRKPIETLEVEYTISDCLVMDRTNPNKTNFKLLRTWLVELRTHWNPGSSTKTELQTVLNPSKKPTLRTCSARETGQNPRPNSGKTEIRNLPKILNLETTNWCSTLFEILM